MAAVFEMGLHAPAQVRVHSVIKIVRYLFPHMAAIDHHSLSAIHHHGLTFFQKLVLPVAHAPSMPGASMEDASRLCASLLEPRLLRPADFAGWRMPRDRSLVRKAEQVRKSTAVRRRTRVG